MKKRNLFVTLGLALGLGIAGLTAATLSSDKVEQVVEAGTATPANTRTIFIGAYSNISGASFNTGDCDIGIYEYNEPSDGNEKFIDGTRIGSTFFTATIDTTFDRFEIVRLTAGSSFVENGWSARIAENHQTWYQPISENKTLFILTGWDNGRFKCENNHSLPDNVSGIEQGRRYYFDAVNVSSFWYDDNAKTYIVFYGPSNYYGVPTQRWLEMTRIPNTDLHYIDLPYGIIGYNFYYARSINGSDIGNRTHTVTDISDCSLVVAYNKTSDLNYEYGFSICDNDAMLYSVYTGYFMAMNLCLDAGGLTEDAATLWEKAKTTYTTVYSLLVSKTYIRNSTGSFIDRYNAVINKNPTYEDFMATVAGVASIRVNNQPINTLFKEESNITIIIVAIAGVSLLTLAGFFLLKRKEDR